MLPALTRVYEASSGLRSLRRNLSQDWKDQRGDAGAARPTHVQGAAAWALPAPPPSVPGPASRGEEPCTPPLYCALSLSRCQSRGSHEHLLPAEPCADAHAAITAAPPYR